LIRFGQNQNLASSKTFDLLRLWTALYILLICSLNWIALQSCLLCSLKKNKKD